MKQGQNVIKRKSSKYKNGLLDIKNIRELKESLGWFKGKVKKIFLKIDERDNRRNLKQIYNIHICVGGPTSE